MQSDTNQTTSREKEANGTGCNVQLQPSPNKSRIDYLINVKIPDECLDPDGGPCPHDKKPIKQNYNPI